MKLVVHYTTGSYDSYYSHTIGVEYESKDHFLVAFINAFEAWANKQQENRKLQKRVQSLPKGSDKEIAAWAEWANWRANNIMYDMNLDGKRFPMFEDYEVKNDVYSIVALPEVYTLDEWFELNRAVEAK